jgi:predicted RNA-binding Zn-ribbon protein involved in translation (DUF1610 family)
VPTPLNDSPPQKDSGCPRYLIYPTVAGLIVTVIGPVILILMGLQGRAPAPPVPPDVRVGRTDTGRGNQPPRPPTEKGQPDGPSTPVSLASQKCPTCGGEMVVRTNRQTGEKFLSCKKFPECRGSLPFPKVGLAGGGAPADPVKVGQESPPLCPKCGKVMVLRTNGSTGEKFWGCSDFPRCRGTRDIP